MPPAIDPAVIASRRVAVRLLDGRQITTDDEAARYLDERGFLPLFTLAGSDLPAMSDADAGGWEGAWRWKEVLPGEGRCAYGKFLRGRGFFISWRLFPAFCRLYGRDTDPADDYEAGLVSRGERAVLQAIAERGPVDSRRLWRELKPLFGGQRTRFEAALTSLQMTFRIMVCGGSLEGWSLHHWDLVERRAPPGLLDHLPAPEDARAALLRQYVANTVACPARAAARFFRWDLDLTRSLAARLVAAGDLQDMRVEGWDGAWLMPPAGA